MNGRFRVLDARVSTDRSDWAHLWETWRQHEVQAHPAYVELFAADIGAPLCAAWESDSSWVLFPFILRDIAMLGAGSASGEATDITTPYGYGGAYTWGNSGSTAVADDFWSNFGHWASTHNVVSAFARLSLFAASTLKFPGTVEAKQDNIVCDLSVDEDAMWMSFEQKVRKNVKKASRSGITVEVDLDGSRIDDFMRIYRATMDRRRAEGGYYFELKFFEQIHRELAGQFAYFHALHEGAVVSTELVLLSADSMYSFLGGTDSEYFALRPNDALKVEAMRWGTTNGKRWFVLGGGYEPGDGIYRYKRGFAPYGSRAFSVGTKIFDPDLYEELVRQHALQGMKSAEGDYFPAYRA